MSASGRDGLLGVRAGRSQVAPYTAAMPIRDLQLLTATLRTPFTGYARPRRQLGPALERPLACVALLSTMVVAGILLGSPGGRAPLR